MCQKDYIEDLVHIVMNENNNESNESVQTKLLALVQSWAFEFSSERELRGIAEVYMKLKDEGVHFPSPTEDDLKEADSEDIEAFFNAHEDDDGPVLEVLENLMEEERPELEVSTTTEEFNKFLEKRVVKVEIEALREELKKEVEQISDEEVDIAAISEDDEEAIIADIEEELKNETISDCDIDDLATDEFKQFLVKRAVAAGENDSN